MGCDWRAQVGKPGLSGLSVEQRKRLTIAVELVANPSIVFMDEPTSGQPHACLHVNALCHLTPMTDAHQETIMLCLRQAVWQLLMQGNLHQLLASSD